MVSTRAPIQGGLSLTKAIIKINLDSHFIPWTPRLTSILFHPPALCRSPIAN